eukprot:10038205-Ditylum_brightwellii.AAC.1
MDTGVKVMHKHTEKPIEEQLQERGDKAINAMQKYETAISINFVLPDESNTYPIRDKFMKLLQVKQQIDIMLTVRKIAGSYQWKVPNDTPTGDEFKEAFAARTDTNAKIKEKLWPTAL